MGYVALWLLAATAFSGLGFAQLSTDKRQTYVVSGTVVNSVTGEAIARALVRANGQSSRSTFSDSEGRFQFEGLPAGQIMLIAQKPGYSNEQDATGLLLYPIEVGPETASQTLKLSPLSAIFGRVIDAGGQPIEHIAVRLACQSLRDGRKTWESRGMTETDEDGHFRFPNLTPETYFVSVGPARETGRILPAGEKPTTGFPHLFYPGVAELASAAPIQLTAGQQYQADFSLSPVPVYHVSGLITGRRPDSIVGLSVYSSAGDPLFLPVQLNSEQGTFSLDSVPAGSYIVKATDSAAGQPWRAEQRLTVSGNLDNVHLALAPAISIPVVIRMQSRGSGTASGGGSRFRASEEHPPINVSLRPAQPGAAETYANFDPRAAAAGRTAMALQNVDPDTYTVNLVPQPPWYVQSATYGETNVLSDDITVGAGPSYPLDIVMRDDGASLTINARGVGTAEHPAATVVLLPQPPSKLMPPVLGYVTQAYTATGLAPGDYLVFAFDRAAGLEYSNPDVLAGYASQAAHVTLTANQQAQVTLDLIQVAKGE